MKKYRGFVGQVAPLEADHSLGDLGFSRPRYVQNGGERPTWRTGTTYQPPPVIQVKPMPPTEATPILEPTKSVGYIFDPTQFDWEALTSWEQEIEARQYEEGGDGTATEIERTAKIDEAIERVKDTAETRTTVTPKPAAPAAPEMPALLPLVIGAGLIWLMS